MELRGVALGEGGRENWVSALLFGHVPRPKLTSTFDSADCLRPRPLQPSQELERPCLRQSPHVPGLRGQEGVHRIGPPRS